MTSPIDYNKDICVRFVKALSGTQAEGKLVADISCGCADSNNVRFSMFNKVFNELMAQELKMGIVR